MKKVLKGLGMAALVVMAIGGAVFAYTAITVTSQVEVEEPISIVSVEGDGTFDDASNVWSIGVLYPLDSAFVTITFANEAAEEITLSLSADPASLDGGNLVFGFDSATVKVPGAGTAAVTLTAETTQSLAPGSYSTAVTVER